MQTRNTILVLIVLLISLQACGPGPVVIPADPEWKVFQNESRWKIASTHIFAPQDPFWSFSITANRHWPRKFKYDQFIQLTNIPRQAGRYSIIEGFAFQNGLHLPVNFEFREVDWDVLRRSYRINEDADNHISIEQYDSKTRVIKGSFYTEWFRIDEFGFDVEESLQVLACEHFRLVLPTK
ncbi:MAG: hypothetical protein AAFQ68_02750 [Bacteroidota bacterium]